MGKVYVRGVGILTRLLIHEGRRVKMPSTDVLQEPVPEAPVSPTPRPERGAVGTTERQNPPVNEAPGPSAGASGKSETGTGCIPCSVNHLSTCSGLLSEALRFARSEGLGSEEVISRVGLCGDELNAAERVDLRAEKVAELPPAEKELAHQLLVEVRGLRHQLENLADAQGLEGLTARMQSLRTQVGKEWWMLRLRNLSPEEKAKLKELAQKKVEAYLG